MDQGMISSLKESMEEKLSKDWREAVGMKKAFPKTSILDAMQLLQSA